MYFLSLLLCNNYSINTFRICYSTAMTTLVTGLNGPQKEAVLATEGPLLVLAGAGSGKTRVLTHRIAHIIEKGVAPASILAITFTNKAAKEMKNRLIDIIKNTPSINRPISEYEVPFVSTFHALGVYIMRNEYKHLGVLKQFTILDRGDMKRIIKKALVEAQYDPKQYDPGKVISAISKHKSDGKNPGMLLNSSSTDFWESLVAEVWEKYEVIKKSENAYDFDDLLLVPLELLKKNEGVRAKYQTMWSYIHIDEYQDTNSVQYELAKIIAAPQNNICVVGDADQNIYSWRGATIEHILNFENEYPDSQMIILEENYRSTQTILSAANDVIAKNVNRKEKISFTKNGEGERITVYGSFDEKEEARYIADEIRGLQKEKVALDSIAILYRANFQSRVLEETMLRKSIPYQVLGTKFFERKEVKEVLAYIHCALNPQAAGALERATANPPRGIGKVTLAKMADGSHITLKGKARMSVDGFYTLCAKIKNKIETAPLKDAISFIIKESGLEENYRKATDGEERIENMRELISLSEKYTHLESLEAAEKLLEEATLASDQDELNEQIPGVKLMTIHASKGLEFDYVFITGLEEGLFPHERRDNNPGHDDEEERRLFYVAITRAGKKLYLTYAQMRTLFGQTNISTPSSFLSDISNDYCESVYEDTPDEGKPSSASSIFMDF